MGRLLQALALVAALALPAVALAVDPTPQPAVAPTAPPPGVAPTTDAGAEPPIDGDVFGAVAPVPDGLPADSNRRLPFNRYQLDTHVRVKALEPSTWFQQQPHEFAQFVWLTHRTLWRFTLSLNDWALGLSLLEGENSPLAALEEVVQQVYRSAAIQGLLLVALALTGLYVSYQMITRRRFGQVVGEVLVMLVFFGAALWVVSAPRQTILAASHGVDRLSAELAGGLTGSSGGEHGAAIETGELLHRTFIHEPWLVLQFGGLRHCAPQGRTCWSTDRRYGVNYLAFPPGSGARDAAYEAVRDGSPFLPALHGTTDPGLPRPPRQITYEDGERGALHLQQGGAGLERIAIAVVILVGGLAIALLMAVLALWVIVAQMVVLLLLVLLPFLVPVIFLPRVNRVFTDWAAALAMALLTKLIAVLGLAILLLFSRLMIASEALGSQDFLLRYLLIAVVFWFVLLKRRMIFGQVQRVAGRMSAGAAMPVPLPAGVAGAGRAAAGFGASFATRGGQATLAGTFGSMARAGLSVPGARAAAPSVPAAPTARAAAPPSASTTTRAASRVDRPSAGPRSATPARAADRTAGGRAPFAAHSGKPRPDAPRGASDDEPRSRESSGTSEYSSSPRSGERSTSGTDSSPPRGDRAPRVVGRERTRPRTQHPSTAPAPPCSDVEPRRRPSTSGARDQERARRERERVARERVEAAERLEDERAALRRRRRHGRRGRR